jgi:hypothetical protein
MSSTHTFIMLCIYFQTMYCMYSELNFLATCAGYEYITSCTGLRTLLPSPPTSQLALLVFKRKFCFVLSRKIGQK